MGNLFSRKHLLENRRKIYPSTSTMVNNDGTKFANNSVKTQKYNILTFIPKNLYEQFHRFANIYFVFILILNFLPEIDAFGKEVAPIPVIFVLSITAIKDAVEDYRRYQADQRVNHSKCLVYSPISKTFIQQKWSNVICGDFIKLHANETIPADIVLLQSKDISGICHIETSNLDGESNLKQREVVFLEQNSTFQPELLSNCVIEVELPNQEIYKFNGTIFCKNQTIGTTLRKNNLLLRGCTLRNTSEVVGIVVYAGKETKAMLNNNVTRFKRSKLERQINKDVIWCVLLLIILCLFCSIGNVIWSLTTFKQEMIYFQFPANIPQIIRNPAMQAFLTFWTTVIYYQAMIPLPLYVTFELVKMHQVFHIRQDIEMFDNEAKKGLEVRAFNIPEDLGQIQYVFCDKTGTLTENRMEFKRAFIDGCDYAESNADEFKNSTDDVTMRTEFGDTENNKLNGGFAQKYFKDLIPLLQDDEENIKRTNYFHFKSIKEFFLLMAICNTTVVSLNKNEKIPVIKSKKSDFRSKLKKHFQMAGEGVLNKAASISSFSAKNLFTKYGKATIKNLQNNEMELKHHHDVLFDNSDHSMELLNFTRLDDGALPISEEMVDVHLDDANQKDHLSIRNKSRKVKSVSDFTRKMAKMYNDGGEIPECDSNVDLDLSSYIDINSQDCNLDGRQSFAVGHFYSESENKCPISDKELLASYESESPDEMALVKTACNYGYKLLQRGPNFVTIWNPELERPITYEVLQVLPFDSNRKRMSIIVKCPLTNEIHLLCKGADSAMFGRFSEDISSSVLEETKDYLNAYATMGLRILVMGKKTVPTEYFESWHTEYKIIEQKAGDNEKELSIITSKIENEMNLLGVSGIEDCLQDGVADTIESLRRAGITVWILTGDKRETAINIAYSAKLISENQKLIQLNANSKEETLILIKEHLLKIESLHPTEILEIRQGKKRPLIRKDLALCIDGDTLTFAMEKDIKMDFLQLAEQCCSVVCARTTPIQKAEIVQLIKENLRMQTLAIGDGANDVSMIQMADVGIGIGGNEGMQAVMASDFAMTKFKYLKRLLLVHGSWCYNKLARTALYMFYKDTIYILLLFWYQFYNAFSASVMIDQLTQVLFNITMTGLPPIIYGIWDKDLHSETLMNNPELYRHGINCKSYKPWHFWVNILDGIWQSLVIFFICSNVLMNSDIGIWEFGQIITACALITCLLHIGIETRFWTWFHFLGIIISFIFAWFIFTMLYNFLCGHIVCVSDNPQYFIFQNIKRLLFWLLCLITPTAAILPRLTINAIRNSLFPSLLTKGLIREQTLGKGSNLHFSYEPELVSVKKSSTFLSSVFNRPSIDDLNRISAEYGISNTITRSISVKPKILSTKMNVSNHNQLNAPHNAKHQRVKSYDEILSNHFSSNNIQPNISPVHHESTSFLASNTHAQPEHNEDVQINSSNINDGYVSQI